MHKCKGIKYVNRFILKFNYSILYLRKSNFIYILIMSDLTLNIADLKGKVEKLVTLHKVFKEENEKLKLELLDLKKTSENQTIKIQGLELENRELLLKKDEETNNIVTTKEKINELVQEIDDCIALLNK